MEVYGRKGMFPEEYEKMFEAIESALGFELFAWQKTYIAFREFRQYGATTAIILRELMMVNQPPMDLSRYNENAELECYRRDMRKIKQQLDEAGVPTREVFFDRKQKEAYIRRMKSQNWELERHDTEAREYCRKGIEID